MVISLTPWFPICSKSISFLMYHVYTVMKGLINWGTLSMDKNDLTSGEDLEFKKLFIILRSHSKFSKKIKKIKKITILKILITISSTCNNFMGKYKLICLMDQLFTRCKLFFRIEVGDYTERSHVSTERPNQSYQSHSEVLPIQVTMSN